MQWRVTRNSTASARDGHRVVASILGNGVGVDFRRRRTRLGLGISRRILPLLLGSYCICVYSPPNKTQQLTRRPYDGSGVLLSGGTLAPDPVQLREAPELFR